MTPVVAKHIDSNEANLRSDVGPVVRALNETNRILAIVANCLINDQEEDA